MSGGHFDYQQFYIDDIADRIENEIEKAEKPKPKKVWKEDVVILEKQKEGWSKSVYMGFKLYDEAVKKLKTYMDFKFIREYEEDGSLVAEFMRDDRLYEVLEIRRQEYEDGNYYPEYTEETIQILKDGVKILRKAAIYAQRIDWFLSGDDGEDTLKERLEKELKDLEGK